MENLRSGFANMTSKRLEAFGIEPLQQNELIEMEVGKELSLDIQASSLQPGQKYGEPISYSGK